MASSQVASSRAATRFGRLKLFLARRATVIRWVSVVLILVALVLLMRTLPTERIMGLVQNWIDGLGMWGPLALGLVYILAALLFIPGWILTLAAGAIYGLVLGTIIVSLASTTAAALAFLIARHLARDRVRSSVEQSPKLAAVDEAIGEQGWKIVALLRLSPAVPFNLQNYLYGVTSIRFWPCVLASWAAMLPGTFVYVYVGSLGKTAASGGDTSLAEWALRGIGLLATIVVTVYVARLARNAIQQRTSIEADDDRTGERFGANQPDDTPTTPDDDEPDWPWSALVTAVLAVALLTFSVWANSMRN